MPRSSAPRGGRSIGPWTVIHDTADWQVHDTRKYEPGDVFRVEGRSVSVLLTPLPGGRKNGGLDKTRPRELSRSIRRPR